ncbi:hypothetical protein [Methylobacterium sp. E-046]|uniref:hypothetical protein n=1 Tax=Methylobacterium sp. E-046 TaxID=2836576 RepID=UPI001FBA1A1D|nr:hypothetical protein [Methylobacterium sp. E-046]MCJ2101987.1 hypothetical protein [Methylobacterium sp. E-046]
MSASEFYQIFSGFGRGLRDQQDREDQKGALGRLGEQVQAGDYSGAAGTAFNGLRDPQTAIGLLKLGEAQQQRKLTAAADADFAQGFGGFGVGGPVGAPGVPLAPAPGVPSFLDQAGPQGDYLTGLFKRESNNNTMAQAPTSSARGLGQFTKDTWNGVAQKYPDLSLTPVGPGTDGRTDPDQMIRATKALTSENEGFLSRANLPVTDATRYALHFLGPGGGVRLVGGTMRNPDVPAASYASPQAVAANRNVFFNRDGTAKSAGQVMNDFARSFGGGGGRGGQQAPAPQVASADPSFAPQMATAPVQGLNPGRPQQATPAQRPVQFADDEAQTQALEQQMGMVPRQAATDPQADMPAPNAQPAQFRIPPGPQQAMPGSIAALPAGLSSPQPRDPIQPPALPQQPVPALPVSGGAPGRVMAMPGDGPVPVAQPVVASPVDRAFSAQANSMAQSPLGQRIPMLMRAVANPNLSDGPRQIAQTMLKQALEETAAPPAVREFLFARANGMTQANNPGEYAREKLRDPGADLQAQIRAREAEGLRLGMQPGSPELQNYALGYKPEKDKGADLTAETNARQAAAVRFGLQPGTPEFRSYVLTGKEPTERDEGAKITSQIAARREAAAGLGLVEGTPAYRSFVGGGKIGADRDMSAGDKKAIDTADNAVLSAQASIGMLEQAKDLSAKAYAGPLASERGKVMSLLPGNEAGQATLELDNLVTTNALTNLKSIFGGNPTEGERKILLDVAGSSSLPHALRVKVYQRAIDAANLRMQQNETRAAQIREGTYYRPGSGPAAAQGAVASGQSGAPALPSPSPSNRPGAVAPAARFQQLMGSGMTKDQAYQQLHSEGY